MGSGEWKYRCRPRRLWLGTNLGMQGVVRPPFALAPHAPTVIRTITKDTKLANNLTNCLGNGIVIGADDITLDLNGHTVDGDGVDQGSDLGIDNTAGFTDDTRAFCSIPARHDLARRVDANWLAGLVARHVIDMNDAGEMARALAYDLARRAYRLE